MKAKEVVTGMVLDEHTSVSLTEVCKTYNLPEEIVHEFIEYGVIHAEGETIHSMQISCQTLSKIQSATRLKKDLGINPAGIAVILDLLDEMQMLRNELNILKRHVDEE